MSAIKPHLAQEDETTPEESAFWECSAGLDALERGDIEACPTPQEVLENSHAGLLGTAWIRKPLVDQMMEGLVIEVHEIKGTLRLVGRFPDQPERFVEGAPWNPYASTAISILSWTTKMGAPSFSLPAGSQWMGGACPGATAGQSIVDPGKRKRAEERLLPVLYGEKGAKGRSIHLADSICESCYAEGGQYSTSSVQYAQLLRFAWARAAVKQRSASGRTVFAETMIEAIDRVNFKSGSEPKHWRRNGVVMRFFRLHDSGDFFSREYFDAWKEITDWYHPTYGGPDGSGHPEPIWFWAPTRMWVAQVFVDHVNEVNKPRPGHEQNFAVRPSAYHVNEHGPLGMNGDGDLGSGWAAASVVYGDTKKMDAEGVTYDWDCRAYAVESGPSCRGAESNPESAGQGRPGCRTCWMLQDARVNYTLH